MRPDPRLIRPRHRCRSRWILDTANTAVLEATSALEAFRFDEYASVCYRFVWNNFCDWFLEFAKPLLAEGADPMHRRGDQVRRRPCLALFCGCCIRQSRTSPRNCGIASATASHAASFALRGRKAATVHDPAQAREELDWVVRLISLVRSIPTK